MKKPTITLVTLTTIVILWEITALTINNEFILPSIRTVFNYAKEIRMESLLIHLFSTLKKTVISFIITLMLSILIGILSTKLFIKEILMTVISIIKTVPTISIIIIFLIIFGRDNSPYIISLLVTLPIMSEAIVSSIYGMDKKLLDMAKVYNISKKNIVLKIYTPSIMEKMVIASKQSIGLSLKVIVMAEILSQSRLGIGSRIYYEKVNINMSGVFYWTIILIIVVLFIDKILDTINSKILFWK